MGTNFEAQSAELDYFTFIYRADILKLIGGVQQ